MWLADRIALLDRRTPATKEIAIDTSMRGLGGSSPPGGGGGGGGVMVLANGWAEFAGHNVSLKSQAILFVGGVEGREACTCDPETGMTGFGADVLLHRGRLPDCAEQNRPGWMWLDPSPWDQDNRWCALEAKQPLRKNYAR